MSNPASTTPAKPADSISWKNISVLLIIFTAGVFTGVATQYADRCPLLNPQVKVTEERPSRQQLALSREQGLYVRKVQEWKKPYQEKIDAVLTPEQKTQQEAHRGMHPMDPPAPEAAYDGPVGPDGVPVDGEPYYPTRPTKSEKLVKTLAGILAYQPEVEKLTKKVKLTDKQKVAVTKIMSQRRDDFLKFIDQNPPPTKASRPLTQEEIMMIEMEVDEI
ncbi:MAG: hypothetical protein B9S32_08060 [Verrucomicrobia bacterium Tous-C9LFEB]|nr:MAG: hypothetical protein B9S32_08060 [Verrucomicrobia bacterium Tous-C9LFEB]